MRLALWIITVLIKMKLITAAFGLLAVVLASAGANDEEKMREAAVACMTELDLMKDVTEMAPEEGRCLTMCFMEKMGGVS